MNRISVGHIGFQNGYEYFWVLEISGRRFVARAPIENPIDISTKQRVGGRFEGTEAWFQRYGHQIIDATTKV